MDIPVSRLNQRMALQLPAEFPLGLVFVVGVVDGMEQKDEGDEFGYFYLAENTYQVRCLLSERASTETEFKDGDKIRAGGHLAFDPQKADYYLLARDIEMLTEAEPEPATGSAILADIDRRSRETGLVPAELPVWVKQLAPPELMAELGIKGPIDSDEIKDAEVQVEDEISDESTPFELRDDETMLTMSDELIDFLSMAMDSTEEIELTPEVIAHLGTPTDPEILLQGLSSADETDVDGEHVGDDATQATDGEIQGTEKPTDSELGAGNEAERDGKGQLGLDQQKPIPKTQQVEDGDNAMGELLATKLEMNDQSDAATVSKASTPWPEIAVVILILAALILSLAVVYVYTSQ
jgi:hypothetical protein